MLYFLIYFCLTNKYDPEDICMTVNFIFGKSVEAHLGKSGAKRRCVVMQVMGKTLVSNNFWMPKMARLTD